MTRRINVNIDFSKCFSYKIGNFFAGTTPEIINNAVAVNSQGEDFVGFVDIHSRNSSEFIVNGGPWPTHHITKKDAYDLDKLGVEKGKIVTPELIDELQTIVEELPSGLIVPKHVFYQDIAGEPPKKYIPPFTFTDVEETFNVKYLDSQEFLDGAIKYVINAKHMYNGTLLTSVDWITLAPGVRPPKDIPIQEINYLTLMQQKHGQGEGLEFVVTGNVAEICVYQGSSNIKQLLPKSRVIIISDAITHLYGKDFETKTLADSHKVMKAMCQMVRIEYITTKEYLGTRT